MTTGARDGLALVIGVVLGASILAGCVSGIPTAAPSEAASSSGSGVAVEASVTPSGPRQATDPSRRPSPAPTTSAASAPPAPVTPVPAPAGGVIERLRAALDGARGEVVLDLAPDTGPADAQLDGTADDGEGPGRLLVSVSAAGSTARGDLCQDREFVQGGSCERVVLPGGDVMYRRGLVVAKGTRTITVAIRRADGSGILLESGNFTIPSPPPVIVAGQSRPTPAITRQDPVFTLDELAALAEAVSSATRGCSVPACP